MNATLNPTAADLLASAAAHEKAAADSFERSDTDGFLTQWAHGISASRDRLAADIAANGGNAEFPALFYLGGPNDGKRAKAKLLHLPNKYTGGTRSVWLVLDGKNNAAAWIGAFPARESTLAKKGFREGVEDAPAVAFINGSGRGLSGNAWAAKKRTDAGYPADAVAADPK